MAGTVAGPDAAPAPWYVRRRRWVEAAAFVLAAAALFAIYLRLSRTVPENSDQANILLVASDMLHGNVLLHGWYLTDVSFYTTELPQYALLEIFFGVHANTAHIAAAMTYTLVVLLAVLLARGGFTSRAAVVRLLITAGILVAPQLGVGVTALILTVGHIGTAVPVLLILLLLDRAPQHWWVPVLTGLGLAWALVADELVLVVAVVPLALVCALRVAEAAVRERSVSRGLATRRYELSLIAAAGVAAGLAWIAERVLRALGGYTLNPVPFTFTLHHITANLHSLWAVPQIFGADYRGLAGGPYYTALLHMVSLAVVGLALLLLAWRFFAGAALVDQVLGVGIVANLVLFVVTSAGSEGPHEIAVVAPFGAALAARMLAGPARQPAGDPQATAARTGRVLARRARAAAAGRPGGPARLPGRSCARRGAARLAPGLRAGRVLAASPSPALRPGRLLGEQHRHRPDRRPGQGQGPAEAHAGAGPVAGQARVVRPGRATGQLRGAVQHAGLHEQLGAARPDQQVLRPPGPGVQLRPLHRHGVEPEPPGQPPALTGLSTGSGRVAAPWPGRAAGSWTRPG